MTYQKKYLRETNTFVFISEAESKRTGRTKTGE